MITKASLVPKLVQRNRVKFAFVTKYETESYLVSSVTTKACNQIHPERATNETSSISLFS